MNLADTLRAATSIAQVLEHEPMARHTTMRVGGPAEILFSPAGEGELLFAVREAKRAGAPFRIIGNGSNLLVLDGGLPGLTIRLGERFQKSPWTEIRSERRRARFCPAWRRRRATRR